MKINVSPVKVNVIEYDDNLKNHLRIFDDSDKDLIKHYINAAGAYIERYLGFPALSTSCEVFAMAKNFCIDLPKNVIKVNAIYERQFPIDWYKIQPQNQQIDDAGSNIVFKSENFLNGFEYKIQCELRPYITPIIRQAAFLLVAEMYENRENINKNVSVFKPSVNILLDLESVE